MTLTQKFANLSPEQREQFAAVKDGAALDTFLAEHGITLTDDERQSALEYFQSGILPLDDDDLDAVAGGASKEDSANQAANDGRTYNMPSAIMSQINGYCACNHSHKWARTRTYKGQSSGTNASFIYDYSDIKCYNCGKTWANETVYQSPA